MSINILIQLQHLLRQSFILLTRILFTYNRIIAVVAGVPRRPGKIEDAESRATAKPQARGWKRRRCALVVAKLDNQTLHRTILASPLGS